MAIKTITVHRVEVTVPDRVWELFGHTREYQRMMLDAAHEADWDAGNDRYSEVIEYAEFSDLPSARAAEAKMNEVVRYFEQKQIEYDKENEDE